MSEIERLNSMRNYWLEKSRSQLDALHMASLEQDSRGQKKLKEDLDTSIIVLWRLDCRYRRLCDEASDRQRAEQEQDL